MKILIIEDDESVIDEVKEALKNSSVVIPFEPTSKVRDEIYSQLRELCSKENFDAAILDYKLWNYLTGDLLISILLEAKLPTIAFSGKIEHNVSLIKLGAIGSINKDNLYGSRGFDKIKFIDQFREII